MPAQLHWPASGRAEPKATLIPCSRGVTRAGQGAEPAQSFRQPCQAGRVMEDYKALVDPPVFTLLCGHSTLILNLTILIKIRDPESR